MATTGPYIIYKSSQFCAAVRSKVDFDNPLRKRIREYTFTFHGVDTLPPRLNLKSLTTAVNAVCQQVREKREKYLMNRRDVKQTRKDFCEQFYSHATEMCENSQAGTPASNLRVLNAAGFLWHKERITDYELYRLEVGNGSDQTIISLNMCILKLLSLNIYRACMRVISFKMS